MAPLHPFDLHEALRGRTTDPRGEVALGWQVWHAGGPESRISVLRTAELLQVVLAETAGGTMTDLVLDDTGRCWATHVASPSLLHVPHADGDLRVVPRDGNRSELIVGLGGVLVQASSALLEAVPTKVLAGLPHRLARARSLAALADDLVRQARHHPLGAAAGVVVIRREWSSSPH